MSKNYLATACWLALCAFAFGLGWVLKPVPGSSETENLRSSLEAIRPDAISALPSASYRPAEIEAGLAGEDLLARTDRIGSGRPLSSAEIEQVGQRFKEELDPIRRRVAFLKLLDGMTVENAKEIRAQIAHLSPEHPAFRDFHYAWGKIGGIEAILNGAKTPKPDMVATLAGWASENPALAKEWFGSLEKQNKESYANQEYLKMGMVYGLANANPDMAAEFVLAMAPGGNKSAEHMYGIVTSKVLQTRGHLEAAAWAESLPASEMRAAAMGRVAHDYARNDPEAAAAWARSVANEEHGGRVVGAISREWAQRDGAAAVGWLESLNDSPHQAGAYYSAFEGWVGKDPTAASEYLVEMPSSQNRDQAIGGLVSRHRWEDPVAAITWAGEIGDPGAREASLVRAAQAYFHRDRTAAGEWLANSGLSAEARKKVTGGGR